MSNFFVNLPPISGGDTSAWLAPVATAAALPAVGNVNGDTRVVLSDYSLWTWNGTKWLKQFPYTPKKSVSLDGVSKNITIGQTFAYEVTSIWSMSFWINVPVGATGGMLSKTSGTTLGWNTYFNSSNQVTFFFNGGGNAMGITVTTPTITTTVWHHVVFTYDGSQSNVGMLCYVDGVLASVVDRTANTCPATILNNNVSAFGSVGAILFLHGMLDEISFYTGTVLSQGNVTELYNGGVPSDLATLSFNTNLTNWYRIGDLPDSQITCYDVVGLANGTAVNIVNSDYTTSIP